MNNSQSNDRGDVKNAKLVTLVQVQHKRGTGTSENPERIVTGYWTLDGMKVAEHDPYTDD